MAVAAATVPALIAELRDHITRITKKPIDPDVDFLTTQIEVLSMCGPIETPWIDLNYGLTPSQGKILAHLASKPGKVFRRESLLNVIHNDPDDGPMDKIVDVFICKLRQTLVQKDAPFWVETVYAEGWRYINRPAREMYKPMQPRRRTEARPRTTLWRGIRMGVKQSTICQVLFENAGNWVSSATIDRRCSTGMKSIGTHIHYIKTALLGSPYSITNEYGKGYRMELKPT